MNRQSSAPYIHDDGLSCGILNMVTIKNPTIEIKGKRYQIGISRSFFDVKCPANDSACLEMLVNIDARTNAICRSYGFKQQLNVRNYSYVFSSEPEVVAFMKKDKSGKFVPYLGKGTDAYLVISSIKCLEGY